LILFTQDSGSNEVSAMPRDATIPNPPTSLSATASSTVDKRIDLLWTASSGSDVKNYLIYRDTVSFTDTTGKRIAILGTDTNYADITSTYGTFYYRLVARDSSGNVSSLSNETSAVSPDKIAPNPPTSLIALPSPVIDKRIDLAWTASISSDVANYLIYRSTATITDTAGKRIAIIGNITSYADMTPSYGQFYYKVFARDGSANVSTPSNEANAVSPGNNMPAAPQNITATAGNRQVTLKWNKNTETDFLKYRVYMGTDSVTMALKDSSTVSISDTTKTNTGLTNGTKYFFRVSAMDSARLESGQSNAASATPSVLTALREYNPDANTVLLLHMNEISGSTVSDASGQNNNGTATGTTIADGRFGKARTFDISGGEYVTINNSSSFNPPLHHTIESWVKYDTITGNISPIIQNWDGFSLGVFPTSADQSTAYLFIRVYLAGTFHDHYGGIIFSKNTWHHLAAVINGNTIRTYVDGVLSLQTGFTGTLITSSNNLEVGRGAGTIDEVRISNIARLPSEFNLQLPPKNLTATPSGTTVNLSWQNGGGAVPLVRYKIYRGADSTNVALIDSTPSISYSNPSLLSGTYYYRLTAVDSTGFEGAMSYAASAMVFLPPTITSFSPASAPIGTTVTITGTNFNTTAAANKVYFGATKAAVISATSTSLTVTVPVGATFAPLTVTDTTTGLTAYSTKPFIVTFFGGGSITASSFTSKVDFTTGTGPYTIAIGDVDGDGKPDLAAANYNSGTVSVFRNTSASGSITASSFTSKVDFTTGTGQYTVAIGDLDGDGKPDVVVTNYNSNTVSVLRNTSTSGSITASSFAPKVDFATGTQPYFFAIGDVDGDGKPDLVVSNYGSNTVSVFRNTSASGSITASSFAAKVDFTTGTAPYSVAIGDVDGDGKPDLVVANGNSSTVSVFRNTSSSGSITASSFASKVDFTTGTTPVSVAISDMDGDGKPDLVVSNYGSNTVSVFRNTSASGSITFASKVDFTTGVGPQIVAIGDIDGDGKPDLAVANWWSNTVSVFRNTSASGSITASSLASKVDFTVGAKPYSVAIGDVDGDGKPDLAVANAGSNTVSVFRNTIAASTTPPTSPTLVSPANGATNQSTSLTLQWNASSGATSYRVQVATDSNFVSGIVVNDSTVTDTTKSLSGLANTTIHYWRVNAKNSAGTSAYSQVRNFTTTPALGEYIADANTILLLHMNETSGASVSDASSYGNYGTATGTTIVDGRFGKARSFNAASDNISVPTNVNLKSSTLTVEAWINNACSDPISCGGQTPFIISTVNGVNASDGGYGLGLDQSNRLTFGVRGTNGNMVATSSSIVPVGAWIHAAAVYTNDGTNSTIKVYINGKIEATGSFTNTIVQYTNVSTLYIGDEGDRLGQSYRRFFGSIDEVRISKIARSPQEFDLQLPPKNLTASASGTTVNLNWLNGGGAVGLLKYFIYRGTDSTTQTLIDSTVNTSYTNSNLANGVRVFYRIAAMDSTGFIGAKSYAANALPIIAVTAPGTPTLLSPATATLNVGKVQKFNWTHPAVTERYTLEVGTDSSFASGIVFRDTTLIDTFYTVTILPYNDTVYWRVCAVNSNGKSPFTATSWFATRVAPPVPAFSTLDTQRVKIKWGAISGAIAYRVHVSSNGTTFTEKSILTAPTDSLIDANLTPGSRYYYRVVAYNSGGLPGDTSAIVNGYTNPAVPKNFRATLRTDDMISLAWNRGAGDFANFRLFRSDAGSPFVSLGDLADSSFVNSSLISNTKYIYRLCTVSASGVLSDTALQISVSTYRILPRLLSATVPSRTVKGDVAVNYNLQITGQDSVYFVVYYSLDSGKTFAVTSNIGGKDSAIYASVNDTLRWESMKDIPGISSRSARLKLVPYGVGGGLDFAPYGLITNILAVDNKMPIFTGLTSTTADSSAMRLSWSIASDNTEPVKYYVYVSGNGTINYGVRDTVVADTGLTIRNLQNFRQYLFAVRAIDSVSNVDTNTVARFGTPTALSRITAVNIPAGTRSGTTNITYTLSVVANDSVRIVPLYSIDGATSFDTIRSMAMPLSVSLISRTDTIQWLTAKDYVLESNTTNVKLVPVGRGGTGVQYSSQTFTLDNRAPRFDGVTSAIGDTNRITTGWSAASDLSTPVQYRIYRRAEGGSYNYASPDTTVSSTAVTIKNLENFKKFYFVVRSVDGVGNVDTNAIERGAIPQMKATVSITQTSSQFNNSGFVKIPYEVKRDARDSVKLIVLYSANNGATYDTARSTTGLTNGYIRNSKDTVTWNSAIDYKNETVDAKIKVIPFGYSGIGIGDSTTKFMLDNLAPRFNGLDSVKSASSYKVGSSVLVWRSARDTSKPISYFVYRSQQPFNFSQQYTAIDSTQTAIDTLRDQQPNTVYYYLVRAKDAQGNVDTNTMSKTFKSALIADYDANGKIEGSDLSTFRTAWVSNNINVADIGPTQGEPPYLVPQFDKQINFEDYFTFARMWNWWIKNAGGAVFAKSYGGQDEGKDSVTSFTEEPVLKPKESRIFSLRASNVKGVLTYSVTLKYDPSKLSIDSLMTDFVDPVFVLKYFDKENGFMSLAVASLNQALDSKLTTGAGIRMKFTAHTRLVEERVVVRTEMFDAAGQLLEKGMKTLEFNWRSKVPETFALSQNYPNPFNPVTKIEYQVPKQARVSLIVYNILGQEVIRLVDNEDKNAGYYQIEWQGRNTQGASVSSGAYIYRLKTEEFVSSKKMLLIR
jgi:hypothetical protein